jgi:hypothetical protein
MKTTSWLGSGFSAKARASSSATVGPFDVRLHLVCDHAAERAHARCTGRARSRRQPRTTAQRAPHQRQTADQPQAEQRGVERPRDGRDEVWHEKALLARIDMRDDVDEAARRASRRDARDDVLAAAEAGQRTERPQREAAAFGLIRDERPCQRQRPGRRGQRAADDFAQRVPGREQQRCPGQPAQPPAARRSTHAEHACRERERGQHAGRRRRIEALFAHIAHAEAVKLSFDVPGCAAFCIAGGRARAELAAQRFDVRPDTRCHLLAGCARTRFEHGRFGRAERRRGGRRRVRENGHAQILVVMVGLASLYPRKMMRR